MIPMSMFVWFLEGFFSKNKIALLGIWCDTFLKGFGCEVQMLHKFNLILVIVYTKNKINWYWDFFFVNQIKMYIYVQNFAFTFMEDDFL